MDFEWMGHFCPMTNTKNHGECLITKESQQTKKKQKPTQDKYLKYISYFSCNEACFFSSSTTHETPRMRTKK